MFIIATTILFFLAFPLGWIGAHQWLTKAGKTGPVRYVAGPCAGSAASFSVVLFAAIVAAIFNIPLDSDQPTANQAPPVAASASASVAASSAASDWTEPTPAAPASAAGTSLEGTEQASENVEEDELVAREVTSDGVAVVTRKNKAGYQYNLIEQTKATKQAAPVEAEETVSLNAVTLKYHGAGCRYYDCHDCTEVSLSTARNRGGEPCKKCGG
jgi:hypothetical protein